MPRKIKPEDLDFEIHVDPSCLSEPMDEKHDVKDFDGVADVVMEESKVVEPEVKAEVEPDADKVATIENEDKDADEAAPATEETVKLEDESTDAAVEDVDQSKQATVEDDTEEPSTTIDAEAAPSSLNEDEADAQEKPEQAVDEEHDEHKENEPNADDEAMDPETQDVDTASLAGEQAEEQEPSEEAQLDHEPEVSFTEVAEPAITESAIEDEAPSTTQETLGDDQQVGTTASLSRRDSTLSSATQDSQRRTSLRTEALIQAAARDIVAQLEINRQRESLESAAVTDDGSYISRSGAPSVRQPSNISYKSHSTRPRESLDSVAVTDDGSYVSQSGAPSVRQPSNTSYKSHSTATSLRHSDVHEQPADDGGDSSSHHENDDDMFSEHSPRSSMGSVSENDHAKMEDNYSRTTRSPRISNISQYDQEENFVPTVKGTPRPYFRSPSSIKALQMSSPPASVLGSPRSAKRTPLPTVSRLGSPSISAQYSPKKTPPRFRRETPPLVLLHVTLLPLHWQWSDVVDQARSDELSHEGKTVLEAWRLLQDRMGDTVLERGILLPHPQNDYEILEERLLEALELPMRRRARILECGHYLGPTNEATLIEESESEDEDDYYRDDARRTRESMERKTHWCSTCHSDIRYDSLGPGKIFRVKVYASNGLMKAGAWEACWKEMERVDVELEPMVDPGVAEEFSRIAAEQDRALELQEVIQEPDVEPEFEPEDEPAEPSYLEVDQSMPQILPSSVPHDRHVESSPPAFDERRRLEEERLKEIYGHTPPTRPEEMSSPPRAPEFMPPESPPSPSVQAFERRQERRHEATKKDSLPELLMEAGRVFMQDKKNVMIVLLSVLIVMFAVRGGRPDHDPRTFQTVVQSAEASTVTVTQAATPTPEMLQQTVESVEQVVSSASSQTMEPCSSEQPAAMPQEPELEKEKEKEMETETIVSERVVRVVETVTETEVEIVKVTATRTQTQTQTQTQTEVLEETETVMVEDVVFEAVEEVGDAEVVADSLEAQEEIEEMREMEVLEIVVEETAEVEADSEHEL